MQFVKYYNPKRQIIGRYDTENKVYTKYVTRSKHLFKKLNTYGIELAVWEDIWSRGCKYIVIHERDTHKTFVVDSNDVKEKGTVLQYEGKQIFIPSTSLLEHGKQSNLFK